MKYIETTFRKYHSNVTGSRTIKSHPDYISVDGKKIDCSDESRDNIMITHRNEEDIKVNYYKLSNEVSFKILNE